jgi:biopolymer transport protein ExbB
MKRFSVCFSVWMGAIAIVQLGLVSGVKAQNGDALEQLLIRARGSEPTEIRKDGVSPIERASRDQQVQLFAEAKRRRDDAAAENARIRAQFLENDRQLAALDAQLQKRAAGEEGVQDDLVELPGVTRQIAGDVATALSQSMISAQYPDRVGFLRGLAERKQLVSIKELERLWLEVLNEMVNSGRVELLKTRVIEGNGSPREAEVVRVGPFIASTEGRYLSYLPSQKALAMLPDRVPSEFTRPAEDLQDATGEQYVRAAVDPSRGVILGLYIERPGLMKRVEKGESVGYVIIAVGLIGALCALYQLLYLIGVRAAVRRQLAHLDQPSSGNPLGRVLLAFPGDPARIEEQAEIAELRISEAVLREIPRLERFQAFLRLAVAAGPLLGLIGTVVGMIVTFQSITESGSSDPKLMANGIGQAMIATVLGLGIAIPLLFANAWLVSLSKFVVQTLDEQSAGLLAESIERKQGIER